MYRSGPSSASFGIGVNRICLSADPHSTNTAINMGIIPFSGVATHSSSDGSRPSTRPGLFERRIGALGSKADGRLGAGTMTGLATFCHGVSLIWGLLKVRSLKVSFSRWNNRLTVLDIARGERLSWCRRWTYSRVLMEVRDALRFRESADQNFKTHHDSRREDLYSVTGVYYLKTHTISVRRSPILHLNTPFWTLSKPRK
jgi:hypothetical protein